MTCELPRLTYELDENAMVNKHSPTRLLSSLTTSFDQHLAMLRVHWRQHCTFPAVAELTTVLGMKSSGGVHKTMNRLVDEGLLKRAGSRYAPTDAFFALLLVGPARSGFPQPGDSGPLKR